MQTIRTAAALAAAVLIPAVLLCGCSDGNISSLGAEGSMGSVSAVESIPIEELLAFQAEGEASYPAVKEEIMPEETVQEEKLPQKTELQQPLSEEEEPEQQPPQEEIPEETALETAALEEPAQQAPAVPVQGSGRLIVLDPGHSANIPSGTEPVGPGASEMKAKDAVGTRGTTTGLMEYDLVLNVCFGLQNELTARGYQVILTRTSNNDSISCSERAMTANNAGAAAFIRVHADGSESASAHGASVLCISPSNPYTASTYAASRRLSECIINSYCAACGCYNRGVVLTDAMSGNNWSRVPTTLIELGFMTNPEEDVLMASAEYQIRMIRGIADGIDLYFVGNNQ